MPIPLAMMLPFMAAQSMLMGDAFGRSFQYGKRKISAMSNEDFNAYDEKSLISDMTKTYEAILPSIKEQIDQSKDLQAFIIASLLDMPRDLLFKFFSSTVAGDEDLPDIDPHSFLSPLEIRAHIRHGHRTEIENAYGTQPGSGIDPGDVPGDILVCDPGFHLKDGKCVADDKIEDKVVADFSQFSQTEMGLYQIYYDAVNTLNDYQANLSTNLNSAGIAASNATISKYQDAIADATRNINAYYLNFDRYYLWLAEIAKTL